MAPSTSEVTSWNAEETLSFLGKQTWATPTFYDAVERHKIDGVGLVSLTKSDLSEMGVKDIGDRYRILRELNALAPDKKQHVTTLLADIAATYSFDEIERRFQNLETGAAGMHSADSTQTLVFESRSDLPGFELAPVSSLMMTTPRKPTSARSGASTQQTTRMTSRMSDAYDHLNGGSTTPFRGRYIKELLAADMTEDDFLNSASLSMKKLKKPDNLGANPSAAPRKHSSQRGTQKLGAKHKFGRSSFKTEAQKLKDAAEEHARLEKRREEEAQRAKEGSATQRRLRAAFQMVDDDSSGVVTNDEVMKILEIAYPDWGLMKLTEVMEAIMEECDKDQSKTLTLREFLDSPFAQDVATASLLHQEREQRKDFLKEVFAQVDKNGDGHIKSYELMELCKLLFPNMTKQGLKAYVKEIMKEADVSEDGIITVDELLNSKYANMLSKPKEQEKLEEARRARLNEVFLQFDEDGTNQLEMDELRLVVRASLPEHPDKSIINYAELIMAECDADRTGTVSLDEFISSTYANMMAGIVEEDLYQSPFEHSALLSEVVDSVPSLNLGQKKPRSKKKKRTLSGVTSMTSLLGSEVESDGSEDEAKAPEGQGKSPGHLKSVHDLRNQSQENAKTRAQELFFTTSTMGTIMRPKVGVLEKERRYTVIATLFNKWDDVTDPSIEGSTFIEQDDLVKVLADFFEWSDDEVHWRSAALMEGRDKNNDGKLDWNEFVEFVGVLTDHVSPSDFDLVMRHLFESVGNVSEEVEDGRRARLIEKLFKFWDYDESQFIDAEEFADVLLKYQGMGEKKSHWVAVQMQKADRSGDGRLQRNEFLRFFGKMTAALSSDDFDFMYYRICRAIEAVQFLKDANRAQIRYRRMMENQLAAEDIQNMWEQSRPVFPMILHGTSIDPARAVEKAASFHRAQIEACMVSHNKGALGALTEIATKGCSKGYWIYITIDDAYEGLDWFLRKVGVTLNTHEGRLNPRFRLFIHAPWERLNNFPPVLTVNALMLDLDQVVLKSSLTDADADKDKKPQRMRFNKATGGL
mmetsp:Transcript_92016/g.159643  ORF Transcript_92016/g.159643 Transcript_92016/m.159643 type:complete len:1036 (-) Transcript_92016:507-3614(-)